MIKRKMLAKKLKELCSAAPPNRWQQRAVAEPMRAVFCGSPDFAVPALDAVVDAGFDVPLVVSQPDRVRGRRGKATPTPVRARGVERGLDTAVLERGKANRVALYERVLALEPDIVLVVAFGHIVREPLLHGGARLGGA